jgi:DNA-binding response OmpR family regulator
MRILVADDDRVMSQLVCGILRDAGHMPIPAYDAMQTMMFAMRAPAPALVVLDINMPGGSGLEVLRKLKLSAKTSQIPILVVSGSTDQGMPKQVLSLGAGDFLAKPVDPEALLRAVAKALGEPDR